MNRGIGGLGDRGRNAYSFDGSFFIETGAQGRVVVSVGGVGSSVAGRSGSWR